jgi:hypothetical protein
MCSHELTSLNATFSTSYAVRFDFVAFVKQVQIKCGHVDRLPVTLERAVVVEGVTRMNEHPAAALPLCLLADPTMLLPLANFERLTAVWAVDNRLKSCLVAVSVNHFLDIWHRPEGLVARRARILSFFEPITQTFRTGKMLTLLTSNRIIDQFLTNLASQVFRRVCILLNLIFELVEVQSLRIDDAGKALNEIEFGFSRHLKDGVAFLYTV